MSKEGKPYEALVRWLFKLNSLLFVGIVFFTTLRGSIAFWEVLLLAALLLSCALSKLYLDSV